MSVFRVYNSTSAAWHDYSSMVQRSGMAWKRNDLDSSETGRTLDGTMHRTKITTKRTLDYTLMPALQSQYAALDTDLMQTTFTAEIEDLHGTMQKNFYCSSFAATLDESTTGRSAWSGGAFTIVEV